MIFIEKQTEPAVLSKLRQQAIKKGLSSKEAYKTLVGEDKRQVRESLRSEQGNLCAYCMCKIPRNDVDPAIAPIVIEHMTPRDPTDGRDTGRGLDYNNLVAVCHGNRAPRGVRTFIDLTCDAHKRNTEFRKINPCKSETLKSIYYSLDGRIDARDPDVKTDLVETLNLNCPSAPLIAERKEALDKLIEGINNAVLNNRDSRIVGKANKKKILKYCTDALAVFSEENNPRTPYAGILIWYLESMIASLSNGLL